MDDSCTTCSCFGEIIVYNMIEIPIHKLKVGDLVKRFSFSFVLIGLPFGLFILSVVIDFG